MQQESSQNYCEHFQNLKSIKKITLDQNPFCKFCMSTNCPLWICLHKNCGVIVCGKSNHSHLSTHIEGMYQSKLESKKSKSFHCIFINMHTAQIRCQFCAIQILDIDQQALIIKRLQEDERKKITSEKQANDPLKFRIAILPFLQNLGVSKIMGQLEYPQGHRKINRGLVGIFADKQNYGLIPGIQLMAQCGFFKDIFLTLKLKQDNTKLIGILREIKNVIKRIQEADSRAIRIDALMKLMIQQQPSLKGYKKKDPFQTILEFLNLLHEYLNYYKVKGILGNQNTDKDQWDLFYKSKEIQTHCPIYDSLASILSLNYNCPQCQHSEQFTHEINFIKLQFPKKRRKPKIIEKQLTDKGYETPRKRGKSLMSYILPQEQLPITIPELLIQFFKQPFHKEKNCPKCQNPIPMKAGKVQFKKIADILLLQINRMPRFSDQIVDTNVLLNYQNINLSPFLIENDRNNVEQKAEMNYEFQCAVGIEKGMFPVVCRSRYNNQLYVIKNQSVEMLSKKNKINPYIICLKKASSAKATEFYHEIIKQSQTIVDISMSQSLKLSPSKDQKLLSPSKKQKITSTNQLETLKQKILQSSQQKMFKLSPPKLKPSISSNSSNSQKQSMSGSQSIDFSKMCLPDFYHIQLKHGVQLPVYHPMVCKHGKLKPSIERKCTQQISITEEMYRHLIDTFGGIDFESELCTECQSQVELIIKRKNREKQLIKEYDSLKSNANVMVSITWLKKWSNYLYSQETPSYFHKGYPFPPAIDNTVLLQNNKCKPNLVKNKDFKVVNVFIFKLLKELYSGGPQIRYKWKATGQTAIQEYRLREIKMQAAQLKSIYTNLQPSSPKKMFLSLQRSNSYMQTVNETEQQDDLDISEPKLTELEPTFNE